MFVVSDNAKPDISISPVLEAPPSPDLPAKEMAELLPNESLATLSSKILLLESMLDLVNRNCKFNDFMREILVSIMKVIKSEAGSLLELDHKNNVLFFRSVVGCSSDQLVRFVVPVGKGLVGHVAESKQPMVINNVHKNDIYLKSIENAVGFEARNVIALPILIRGKVFGVLEFLNRFGEDEYTASDVELLTYACNAASKAIEARLTLGWAMKSTGTESSHRNAA